jgi:DNA-binding PadR family transcriptional regulator
MNNYKLLVILQKGDQMKELTKAEETLLLAILRLKDNAYGVAIKRLIQKITGKALPYGTLYFILEQLTKKGFVKRTTGEPKPERGGRSRIYYTVTPEGSDALKHAYRIQQTIWNGYTELTWDEKTGKRKRRSPPKSLR